MKLNLGLFIRQCMGNMYQTSVYQTYFTLYYVILHRITFDSRKISGPYFLSHRKVLLYNYCMSDISIQEKSGINYKQMILVIIACVTRL